MIEKNEKQLIVGASSKKKWLLFIIIIIGLLPFAILLPQSEYGYFEADLFLILGAIVFVAGIVLLLYSSRCSITVTDKRVYGKAAFGTRVDLPFDMISAVGTTGITHGIEVATSSGKIKFLFIENAAEIHTVISKLLMSRQDKNNSTVQVKQEVSAADELKKYKELLDNGVISQEEFDAKKKQLLGL